MADLLDNLEESIVLLDSEMKIAYANPSQATLWNLNRNNMIGKNIYELVPKLSDRIFDDQVLDALSRDEIVNVEWMSTKTNQTMNSIIFPSIEGIAMVSRTAKTPQAASTSP